MSCVRIAAHRAAAACALAMGAAGAAWAALPPPTPEEAQELARKKYQADLETREQAIEISAAMDRVAERYRERMRAQGREAPEPVPVAGAKELRQEFDKFKELGPPTVHQGSPTTTMPPAKPSQQVESVPGQGVVK